MGNSLVRLKHPLFSGSLSLKRLPKYLRFCYSGAGISRCANIWDALDQPDDEPCPGESLLAAVLVNNGSVHIDRSVKGRRVGSWHQTADYELVDPQPSQEVMRDRATWQAWCMEQEKQALALKAEGK